MNHETVPLDLNLTPFEVILHGVAILIVLADLKNEETCIFGMILASYCSK